MSHPTKKKLFDAWAKAMVAGATVGKPDYGKTRRSKKTPRKRGSMAAQRRRRRKRAKKKAT